MYIEFPYLLPNGLQFNGPYIRVTCSNSAYCGDSGCPNYISSNIPSPPNIIVM